MLESNGCKKELGDVSLFLYASVFFGTCFFQVRYIMATYFHVQKLMRESVGLWQLELILGKRIVSKSSLSLHTQNFKLKKKIIPD